MLRLGRREQGAWALGLFEGALRAGAKGPVLGGLHDSPDLPTRRLAARIAVEAGASDVRELARRAAAEPDPTTSRTWTDAALALVVASPGGPDAETVDTLLGGHGPTVRAAGVTLLLRAGRSAGAGRYLADHSGLVRACARWVVRQDGADPYALTRVHVTGPGPVTAAAVLGFAECAGREDAPLLRALLNHPAGAARAGAVAGLRLLDFHEATLLEPLLDDPSPAVAREAALSLRAHADRPAPDRLLDRIAPGRPPHTRRAAYRLLRARGGVAALRASVELPADGEPDLRRIAAQHVQSLWSPSRPPALPFAEPEVGALLDRCAGLFSDHVMGRMRQRLGLPLRQPPTNG